MKLNARLKEEVKKFLIDKMRDERQKVVVYSSVKLSGDDKRLLVSKLQRINFKHAEYRLDPSIIAGVVVTVGSKVIDLSLKGTLSNLKHIVYESD